MVDCRVRNSCMMACITRKVQKKSLAALASSGSTGNICFSCYSMKDTVQCSTNPVDMCIALHRTCAQKPG
jgi:hypothetical protein